MAKTRIGRGPDVKVDKADLDDIAGLISWAIDAIAYDPKLCRDLLKDALKLAKTSAK